MIRVEAGVENENGRHRVALATHGRAHAIANPPDAVGRGPSASGGALLCLALATCFCNGVCREAAPRGIAVVRVDVTVAADFGGPGAPAQPIEHRVAVHARAGEDAIRAPIAHTDRVAEVHGTLRRGMPVTLAAASAVTVA